MPAKYHTCGHPIWLEHFWNGLSCMPIFIDDDDTSLTCGQEIDLCPTCGDLLSSLTEFIEIEPNESLTKPQILVLLRRLKEEIERECGNLTEEQLLLLVDVCEFLGFHSEDAYYVVGTGFDLVMAPLSLQTRMGTSSFQEGHCAYPATHLSNA